MKVRLVTPFIVIKLSIVQAIEGARFAKKSLGKGDSEVVMKRLIENHYPYLEDVHIGEKDLQLACKLAHTPCASGHDKFLQPISLFVDITLSRSMWQEFDTYRIGVSKQSESTMHTITQDEFSLEDFELDENLVTSRYVVATAKAMVIHFLSIKTTVDKAFEEKVINETEYRETIKKILPECFLQKRRVSLNYAVLKTMYKQRINHRNREWPRFLNYMKENTPFSSLWIGK